jgi:hypothetical protein
MFLWVVAIMIWRFRTPPAKVFVADATSHYTPFMNFKDRMRAMGF